jgi:hypothetical protein
MRGADAQAMIGVMTALLMIKAHSCSCTSVVLSHFGSLRGPCRH